MNSSLPSGTVTFLFTDMEGSTPLWEQMPVEMRASVAQHHAILRGAIEGNGGQIFEIIGDAFSAAFRHAQQGLAAAVAAQRALGSARWGKTGPLKVRMGLHTGEIELDPQGITPYAGSHTLNRVARIMAVAYGGQILLSQEAADLVERDLPEGVTLQDLGEHPMKGMQRKEHLYQVCAPGLEQHFPPLATAAARRGNLPVQLTSFVGREKEIAAVRGLLEAHRLVTLTGSGGTGKTRLSLQMAAEVGGRYPDGAWLVELAPLTDPGQVAHTVITTFGLHETRNRPPLDLLESYLVGKRLLLVLDNCEHLIDACAALVVRLLEACPRVTILASSREPLGVPGEMAYRVPSMSTPDPRQPLLPQELIQVEAVRLFAERAEAVVPGFSINEANDRAVAQLCRRLDGIPLAIELAAARVALLTVEQIAARLDDRFRLLTGGSRTALPRQQTLRASIDWSYSLLTGPERLLLMRLAVFQGGWTLEAAEAVCGFAGLGEYEVLDGLDQLVKKSLVVADSQSGGEVRYHLLETIRQYAREKLLEQGEGEKTRDRHLDFFMDLAERAEPHLRSFEQVAWSDRLEAEIDNLRSALVWSEQKAAEKGMRIAWALRWYCHSRGHAYRAEIAEWLDRVMPDHPLPAGASPEQVRTWADGINAQAFLTFFLGQNEARVIALYETAEALYHSLGPAGRSGLVFLYQTWGANLMFVIPNPIRARELMQKSLAVAEELGDTFGIAESLPWANQTDDLAQTIHLSERTLALRRQIGDLEGMWWDMLHLSRLYHTVGDDRRALSLNQEGMEIAQQVKNIWGLGLLRYARGLFHADTGQIEEAVSWMELALEKVSEVGSYVNYVYIEIGLASVLRKLGDARAAAYHFQEALSLARKERFWSIEGIIRFCQGEAAWGDGDIDLAEQCYHDVLTIGHQFQSDSSAFGLFGLGKVALERGDWLDARAYFRQALQSWRALDIHDYLPNMLEMFAVLAAARIQTAWHPENNALRAARLNGAGRALSYLSRLNYNFRPHFEPYDLETCLAPARRLLGEEQYQKAYTEGQAMPLEQAVALALEDGD